MLLIISYALTILALGYVLIRGPKKVLHFSRVEKLPPFLHRMVVLLGVSFIAFLINWIFPTNDYEFVELGTPLIIIFFTLTLALLYSFHKLYGATKKMQLEFAQKEQSMSKQYEEQLKSERETLQQQYQNKFTDQTEVMISSAVRRMQVDKKNWINDVYTFSEGPKDDFFELKKSRESLEKQKETVERDKFRNEMDGKIAQANEHVLKAKTAALEVKSENVELRSELQGVANDFKMDLLKEQMAREKSFDALAHQLELEHESRRADKAEINAKLSVMDAQTKAHFAEMRSSIANTLKDLQVNTANAFRQVHENMSDMKLQFGKEILRLDGQQGKILTELEKYHTKSQQFINQCQTIANDAKQQNLNGQVLLNKVETLYKQHSNEVGSLENRLRSSMDEISLKERQLANSVGESMLKLKYLSDEQYSAMRELALEKKDVDLLWREKNSEHEGNLQEVRHQKDQLDMTRKLANQEQQGNIQEVKNQRSLLDMARQLFGQEQSSFETHRRDANQNDREMHRNFIKEEEYKMALGRAQRSGVWLDRWGR